MATPVFITGIGTDVGKTVVSAIVTEALLADYWKPIQAGFDSGTDTGWVRDRVRNSVTVIHPELYRLALPASPHLAAREEHVRIGVDAVGVAFDALRSVNRYVVVEGAGGLLVPLNEREVVADLAVRLNARVILVSRNYLGSINHSLLTAEACKSRGLRVAGWIFNGPLSVHEQEISDWTGYPVLGRIPLVPDADATFVHDQAQVLRTRLTEWL